MLYFFLFFFLSFLYKLSIILNHKYKYYIVKNIKKNKEIMKITLIQLYCCRVLMRPTFNILNLVKRKIL